MKRIMLYDGMNVFCQDQEMMDDLNEIITKWVAKGVSYEVQIEHLLEKAIQIQKYAESQEV